MYFACDSGSSITIYGLLSMGSTKTIPSVYILLSSLQALKDWAETTFRASMETWFMCDQASEAAIEDAPTI